MTCTCFCLKKDAQIDQRLIGFNDVTVSILGTISITITDNATTLSLIAACVKTKPIACEKLSKCTFYFKMYIIVLFVNKYEKQSFVAYSFRAVIVHK